VVALGTVCAFLAACGDADPQGTGRSAVGDFTAACETKLEAVDAASPRELAWNYAPGMIYGSEQTHPLGRIIGAAFDESGGQLYVLDALNHRLVLFDSGGTVLGTIGRKGDGPGEFSALGSGHGVRSVYNQVALLPGSALVVADEIQLHVFEADGRFRTRLMTSARGAGPFATPHLGVLDDSSFLFAESGVMRVDSPDARVRDRLLRLVVSAERIDTVPFGAVHNPFALLPPFDGFPPRHPYLAEYRRLWDASSGLLVVVPLRHFGICYFDPAGELLTAFRVDAPVQGVGRSERERVTGHMKEAMARMGLPAPTGARELYPLWPEHAPLYRDVVLAPDSTAWALRQLPGHGFVIDVFEFARGYIGSIEPFAMHLPLTFMSSDCVLVRHETDATYGLQRWCRR